MINMKGKFRILGNIGLALFLACALMLAFMPAVPVSAATAVTDVWVEFEDADNQNESGDDTGNVYLIHFKPTTALKRGVDTVTVTFPDGTATMSGTLSTAYDFSLATTMAASEVTFTTDYKISGTTWTACTVTPVVGGYRAKVAPPIDLAAGSDVWIKFASDDITSATTAGNSYKVYVSTSKDTTAVLSSAFSLDTTVSGVPTTTVSPATAGAVAQYLVSFDPAGTLTADTHTVTIQFPVGTVLPSSITAANVQFSDDNTSYVSTGATPIVDTDKRLVTATTSVTVDGSEVCYVKILSAAGITNPTRASSTLYKTMVRSSVDGEYKVGGAHAITAGAATQVMACNGNIGTGTSRYSDDATMINMLSSQIFVTVGDAYGNAKLPAADVTVTPSSSSATGTFYKNAHVTPGSGAYSTITSITVSQASPAIHTQQVYYKDTAAGTYTLTFTATNYTSATWTITVAPAVSVYDANNVLVSTYAATSTSPVAEIAGNTTITTQMYGGDYVTNAINAAMAGDTVKLGDGIYEMDDHIDLDKKITLTSVNGASSTTLRPVTEGVWIAAYCVAVEIGISGTAASPVIIDGLTFTRLRLDTEFDIAIFNNGYNYVTVRNCTFNYILPDQGEDNEWGSVVQFIIATNLANSSACTITSATISNNTFNNCCPFAPVGGGDEAAVINLMTKSSTPSANYISGATISGNTFTDCNGFGICLNGYPGAGGAGDNESYITAEVTDNTLTNCVEGIMLKRQTHSVKILRNTINGAYTCGLYVGAYLADHDSLVIKNNTFTGCAGATKVYFSGASCAVRLGADGYEGADPADTPTDTVNTFQYNDIYDNDATYSIYSETTAAQDCQYNYFGDATGPAYTALTGATIAKSNPNGTGKQITDVVTYYPWLHTKATGTTPSVVADNVSYQACTMKLVAGWNTLSTPVPLIAAADTIDELIPSGMTIAYAYDGGWKQINTVNYPTGYTLSPCDAVYVKMSAVTYVLLKFDAGAFTTPSKDLAAGWNLISLAYLDSAGKTDLATVASVAKTAANLPGYSQLVSPSLNATQTNMFGVAGTSWAFAYGGGTVSSCFAGLGYWCYMQNAATLAGFEITPIAPDLD